MKEKLKFEVLLRKDGGFDAICKYKNDVIAVNSEKTEKGFEKIVEAVNFHFKEEKKVYSLKDLSFDISMEESGKDNYVARKILGSNVVSKHYDSDNYNLTKMIIKRKKKFK